MSGDIARELYTLRLVCRKFPGGMECGTYTGLEFFVMFYIDLLTNKTSLHVSLFYYPPLLVFHTPSPILCLMNSHQARSIVISLIKVSVGCNAAILYVGLRQASLLALSTAARFFCFQYGNLPTLSLPSGVSRSHRLILLYIFSGLIVFAGTNSHLPMSYSCAMYWI